MVSNEVYEKEIEKIAPKLKELEGRPFDEIMQGLRHEIFYNPISQTLVFALTYILDPSRFFIEISHLSGRYTVKFKADTPLGNFGTFFYKIFWSDKRPTDKEARDFIKEFLLEGSIDVEKLIKRAKEVVDTCKIIQG